MDRSSVPSIELSSDRPTSCTKPYLLSQLEVGAKDKLSNKIVEILWIARNYAIYRSERGVQVHFSDCPQEEDKQRSKFTQISSQLCELRYLTEQMRSWRFGKSSSRSSIYHHNMAQAVMLVMEDRNGDDLKRANLLADKTLNMAVDRVTNDNMIRYLLVCLLCWSALTILALWALWIPWPPFSAVRPHIDGLKSYVVGGMFGATGAMLSVATRLQAFKLKPCNQSNMNYWMAFLRIQIGVIAGTIVLLLTRTVLSDAMNKHAPDLYWEAAAGLGLIAGFTERLVPSLLQRTGNELESSAGTPWQATQQQEKGTSSGNGNK